jgi:agmatinase
MNFDPGGVGQSNGNFFGFPFSIAHSKLVLVSVPWDVTTSYSGGASKGPEIILEASPQLDFYHPASNSAWQKGIATAPPIQNIRAESDKLRPFAKSVIAALETGDNPDADMVDRINQASSWLNQQVYDTCASHINEGRIVGLVGGDHSTPYGLIKAISEKYPGIGVLQIDAHADLREAYEGFSHSHASIMYNVLQLQGLGSLTQAGIRDYSQREAELASADPRVHLFDDRTLRTRKFCGENWRNLALEIIDTLPREVYVSFDIDGLQPSLCPNTGTPVPGGFSFEEAVYLIHLLRESGRRIVGFDVNEVSPGPHGDWDANVGARVLFELCCYTLAD